MCFKLIIAIFLTIFLASAALGGDLYLLRIDNKESLKIAEETIDHAYGTLDNRFIVELNARQLGILQRAGIEIELIKSKWTPDQTYLINRMHPEMAAKMPAVRALYASEKGTLAELSAADVDNLRKEYFLVVPIADKKTPLFYTPVIIPSYYRDVFPNDSLANRINQDSIYANNLRLEQFRTRYIYTDSCYAARDWIISKFHSYGYTDVYYDSFDYYGRICNNVICRKPGVADPDNTIVVGGHYDSINQDSDPNYYAPGADDNGSGVAAVLELARVLKDIPLKKSVMFIAFSAEEVGLVGSYVAASNLYYSGTKVEFMLNFDMIGFTADAQPDVTYFYGFSSAYAQILGQAALRVTDLQPFYGGHAGNSDHASFDQFGFFTAYVQEGDFNTAGWHHDADVTARMDFPYMAKELKMSVAALGQIDLAASPTAIDNVFDAGDGQGLLVAWDSNCKPEYTYKVMYGIQTGIYTDTIDVPPATCSYDLSGLTLGQKYYLTVLGVNPEGHGPVYTMEASATPYEIPQAPDNFEADPDMGRIHLIWRANKELDLNHYCLYRRIQGGSWGVLQDNLSDTAFSDTTALPHISFEYVVCAVDNDGNYSDSSDISGATMASFDGGVLFVEETSSGGMDPTNEQQEAYYDSILGGEVYTKYYVDSSGEALSRSIAGQYGSIIWIDDDVSTHLFLNGQDSIRWYLGYDSTDLLLAGNESVFWLASSNPQYPGDFVYDNFGITRVFENQALDFTGATGVGGWPTLHVNPNGIFGAKLPCVSIFQTLPGAQVIYTYNSFSGDPTYQGEPAGVIYEVNGGKRIALSFPIYYLNEADAQALMAKVFNYFGEESTGHPFGDANYDGRLNALDVTYIINYLYKNGPHPPDPDYADPNGSCTINALDVTFLINNLYKGGRPPVAGCVP